MERMSISSTDESSVSRAALPARAAPERREEKWRGKKRVSSSDEDWDKQTSEHTSKMVVSIETQNQVKDRWQVQW